MVEELTDEVLVYDVQRNKAHCLNSTAAAVWKLCDGRNSPAQIARRLSNQEAKGVDEAIVWLALERLGRDHLLKERVVWQANMPQVSRREAIRRIGMGAAIALPIVASITAPTAVQAGTCKPRNASCSTGAECCSTVCSAGHCA